jgi:polygalacturonase
MAQILSLGPLAISAGPFRGRSLLTKANTAPAREITYDIAHFGAKADGIAVNTIAIQEAIDACAADGGGRVLVPGGQYVTGTILLKSKVTLYLDRNAALLGSMNPNDYKLVDAFVDGVNTLRGYTLIGCTSANRVGIEGLGTIDGRGAELQRQGGKHPGAKAFLLRCVYSDNITIRNVKFRNSSAWTMHLFQCSTVAVENISIHSIGLANNDGIDIDSSHHVTISGCTIESDDDAICLKTTSSTACRDIHVNHCTLSSSCAGLKIGTESLGDFSDIHFENCVVTKANRSAIKLLSVDGSHIARVTIENITVESADTPVFLRLGARLKTFRPKDSQRGVGSISDITIKNVSVANARRVGILMSGIPGSVVRNVALENIHIIMSPGDPWIFDSQPAPSEEIGSYPENNMFGPALPAYGMYIRHIAGLDAKNVQIELRADSSLAAIVCSDGHDLNFDDVTLDGSNERTSAILLQEVQGAFIHKLNLKGRWTSVLRVEGKMSNDIILAGISLPEINEVVSVGEGASVNVVKVR